MFSLKEKAKNTAGAGPGGATAPRKTYDINFIHNNFVQFRKQHSRYNAVLSSVVLLLQCCEVYFIFLTVARLV